MRKLSISRWDDEKSQNHTERRKLTKLARKVVSKQVADIEQKSRNSIKNI
jgi:hypothetical protein